MGQVADQVITDRYALHNGDAMEVMPGYPDGCMHGVVYSPPFAYGDEGLGGAGLYKNSSSERDLSNAGGDTAFFEMYEFFVRELHRLTMPGRRNAAHCMDTPTGNSGGDARSIPRRRDPAAPALGFDYLGRHCHLEGAARGAEPDDGQGPDPQDDRGLRHVRRGGRRGLAADLRKKGKNPVPVTHPHGFTATRGPVRLPTCCEYRGHQGSQLENRYSQWVWRQYAGSVWDDIRGNLGQWDDRGHIASCRTGRPATRTREARPPAATRCNRPLSGHGRTPARRR